MCDFTHAVSNSGTETFPQPGRNLAETWRKPGGNLAETWQKLGGNLAETWRKPVGSLANIWRKLTKQKSSKRFKKRIGLEMSGLK